MKQVWQAMRSDGWLAVLPHSSFFMFLFINQERTTVLESGGWVLPCDGVRGGDGSILPIRLMTLSEWSVRNRKQEGWMMYGDMVASPFD
jgi:hypothetical protein